MNCTNCGREVPDVANVCGYCGTKLRQPETHLSTHQPVQPPAPALQPRPHPRAGPPGWVWGLIGGLVIVIVAMAFLFLNGSEPASPPVMDQPEFPSPTAQLQAPTSQQADSAPSSVPKAIPTKRSTTSTLAPEKLPNGVSDFLIRAEIIEADDFSKHTDLWGTSDSGVRWSNGYAEVTGRDGFSTYISRGPVFDAGQAALFLFTYDSSTVDMNFLLDQGDWETSGYARYGVNLQERPLTSILKGTQELGGAEFSGNLTLEEGGQYYVLLAIDGEKEFAAIFWDADDPTHNVMYRNGRLPQWPANDWYLLIQANKGTIKLDEYYLLKFAEFVF